MFKTHFFVHGFYTREGLWAKSFNKHQSMNITHPLMYNWFSRSSGFCYDSASNPLAYRTVTDGICQQPHNRCTTGRAAKNEQQTFGSSRKKQSGECWQFAKRLYDHWHIAAVTVRYANGCCLICHSRGSRRQVVAKSAGSREPVFTPMDMLLFGLSL
jgi:hypothetical protein